MAVKIVGKYLILLCMFNCLCCVTCQFNLDEDDDDDNADTFDPVSVSTTLNLTEGAACISDGHNGTCVPLYKCITAELTYIYRNADYDHEYVPKFPEICSINNGKDLIVCCTDCGVTQGTFVRANKTKQFVLPNTELVKSSGRKGRDRCLDNFQYLPYQCHGGGFKIETLWNDTLQCNGFSIARWLAEGGREAERWEFPHMALLGYGQDKQSAQWLCGGSVISERFILTAAHCSSTHALGPVTFAALGLLKRTDPPKYWKIYKIKRIIMHPEYKSPSKYHDIALLETEDEINFGINLLPACLDDGNSLNRYAEAAGWGQLGHRKGLADTLQVVDIYKFDDLQCALTYPPHRHMEQGYNHTTQMCYGSENAIINTCQGDSGGPLQINEVKCLYTIIGVTSYGKDCGILGSPGMYTRVSYYVPWIESIVWP